jgi:hypothetical protein
MPGLEVQFARCAAPIPVRQRLQHDLEPAAEDGQDLQELADQIGPRENQAEFGQEGRLPAARTAEDGRG